MDRRPDQGRCLRLDASRPALAALPDSSTPMHHFHTAAMGSMPPCGRPHSSRRRVQRQRSKRRSSISGLFPAGSRLAEALSSVHDLYRPDGPGRWQSRRSGSLRPLQLGASINNACLIIAGLLWGEGDFTATVGLTVQGSMGHGLERRNGRLCCRYRAGRRPASRHFIEPLEDRTRSAVFGFDNSRISELARRTTALAQRAG